MASIKQFIMRRLKENVPLSEIRKDLKEKGYDLESINKAVRGAISGVNRKTSNATLLQIGILVVGVAIAIGVAVYLTAGEKAIQSLEPISSEELDGGWRIETYTGKLISAKEIPNASRE